MISHGAIVQKAQSKSSAYCTISFDIDSGMTKVDQCRAKRLVQARETAGFENATDACERFVWTYNTYIQHERGQRGFANRLTEYAGKYRVSVEWLMTGKGEMKASPISQNRDHAANVLQIKESLTTRNRLQKIPLQTVGVTHIVPAVGKVEAGAWREMADMESYTEVVECELPEYQGVELFCHYVEGTSINKFVDHGGKVVWVPVDDAIGGLQQGDYVIVRRPNKSGQFEITVKQLEVTPDGTYQLWPRSNDPAHTQPYIIPPRDEHAQEGIEIVGVVVDRRAPKIVRSNQPVPANRLAV